MMYTVRLPPTLMLSRSASTRCLANYCASFLVSYMPLAPQNVERAATHKLCLVRLDGALELSSLRSLSHVRCDEPYPSHSSPPIAWPQGALSARRGGATRGCSHRHNTRWRRDDEPSSSQFSPPLLTPWRGATPRNGSCARPSTTPARPRVQVLSTRRRRSSTKRASAGAASFVK